MLIKVAAARALMRRLLAMRLRTNMRRDIASKSSVWLNLEVAAWLVRESSRSNNPDVFI